MAFIGNQPALAYTSFAVQHFTTSATTSYTLDYPVANENEIRLVINNVVQQPGSSYAYTASGTSLTLSAATTGTDTMYAVFLGKAVQTVNPPNGSVGLSQLSATGTKDSTTFLRGDNTFASPSADYVRLATTTVSSAVSEVNFTTGFSDTYKIYEIELINVDTSAAAYLFFRWGYGGTPTYVTSGYIDFALGLSGFTDSSFNGKNTYNRTTAHEINTGDHTLGNTTGYTMNGKIRLFNCRSTSTYFKGFNSQVIYLHSGVDFGTSSHTCGFNSDTTLRDSAVTGFKIYTSTGNIDAGTFVLYGIKTS